MEDTLKFIKQAADKINVNPTKYEKSNDLAKCIKDCVEEQKVVYKRLLDMPPEIQEFAKSCFNDENEVSAKIVNELEDIQNIKSDVVYVSGAREVMKLEPNVASKAIADNILKKCKSIKGDSSSSMTIYFPEGSYLDIDMIKLGYNISFNSRNRKMHFRKGSSRPITFKINASNRHFLLLEHKKEKAMDQDMVDVLDDYGI